MFKKFLLLIASQCIAFSALAASGQAHISPFENYYTSTEDFKRAWINVSNITDEPVVVSLTLYDKQGTLFVDTGNTAASGKLRAQYNYTNYSESVQGKSAEFTLAANSTARFHVQGNGSGDMVYGKLEWNQDSDALVALVSNVVVDRFVRNTSRMLKDSRTILINSGNPF